MQLRSLWHGPYSFVMQMERNTNHACRFLYGSAFALGGAYAAEGDARYLGLAVATGMAAGMPPAIKTISQMTTEYVNRRHQED